MSKSVRDLLMDLNIKEIVGDFDCANNNLTSLERDVKIS